MSRDDDLRRESRDTSSHRERIERLTTLSRRQHSRNDSGTTTDYGDGHHQSTGRRHDYDVQAMESDLSPRPGMIRNPIPAPMVTVRSEYPTLNRSRQQQSLTCLITVEVSDNNWHPDLEDLHQAPAAQLPQDELMSPAKSPRIPVPQVHLQYESQEVLDEIAEELRTRVENWHGLEFERYAELFI